MTKDKFLRRFFALYIVLVLQNVISLAVNLADNIMLGAYSEQALAGAAAVNQVQFVYQQLLTAMGDGLVIFCSQYWGKRQTGPMKKIAVTAMHAALALAVILTAAASLPSLQQMRESYGRGCGISVSSVLPTCFLQSHRYFLPHCAALRW